VTNPTDNRQPIALAVLSRALEIISALMLGRKVDVVNVFDSSTIGSEPLVHVDVTGRPDWRDELLAGIDAGEPEEWRGEHGAWRDWRGTILTMRVLVTEQLDAAGSAIPAVDFALQPTVGICLGAPAGYEADCGHVGPHGEHPITEPPAPIVIEPEPAEPPACCEGIGPYHTTTCPAMVPPPATDVEHPDDCTTCPSDLQIGTAKIGPAYRAATATTWQRGTRAGRTAAAETAIMVKPDLTPEPERSDAELLGLLVTPTSPWAGPGHPPAIDLPREPGLSTTDLQAKYAGVPGVVVVPGARPGIDSPGVREAWAKYARARAILHFGGRDGDRPFATMGEAVTALNCWHGRDMLETDDVIAAAEQLVDPALAGDEPEPEPRGRLLSMLPKIVRRVTAGARA
jgi:hypothetical protein